jgi:hypothetical protein
MDFKWDHSAFVKETENKALDAEEEFAKTVILPQCQEECPVDKGVMRDSLGVERVGDEIHIGGGGAASAYILRQHQDMSLNHGVGKAKFIQDPVEQHAKEMAEFIEKRIKS